MPQEYTKELTASRPVISGLIVRLTLKTETANTALAASFTKKTGKTASAGVPVLSSAAKAAVVQLCIDNGIQPIILCPCGQSTNQNAFNAYLTEGKAL